MTYQHLADGYLLHGPTSQGLNPVHTNCLAPGGHPDKREIKLL